MAPESIILDSMQRTRSPPDRTLGLLQGFFTGEEHPSQEAAAQRSLGAGRRPTEPLDQVQAILEKVPFSLGK